MARRDGGWFAAERIDGEHGIDDTQAGDGPSQIGIEQNRYERGIAIEKIVGVPEIRPWDEDDQ